MKAIEKIKIPAMYEFLRFPTVSRRMYIVKNFVYLSSKPLGNMLFKSFIMSCIAYCLPIVFICIYASDKKAIRKSFKDCSKLGIEHLNTNLHIQKLTKELVIKYIVDNDHFIYNFLSQCPSGRYWTIKYRVAKIAFCNIL